MAAYSIVNKLSKLPSDHMSPDRPSQPLVLSTPATSDVIMGTSSTQRPPAETFTLFKLLPSELRLRFWEFACAAPGPRIHFLEPIVDSDDAQGALFWDRQNLCWCDDYRPGYERARKMRWQVTKSKDDPSFRWSGQELLDVCTEARSVFLNHTTTGNSLAEEQSHNRASDMVQTSDIVCVRVEKTNNGIFVSPSNPCFGRVEKQFCDRDKRPSPRLLALELPFNPPNQHGWWYPLLVPSWSSYGDVQNLIQLDQLDVIYILDQHIKPRDDCNNQRVIAPERETEVFEGHHGSKFISINPEDDHALQHWAIPRYCWEIFQYFCSFRFTPRDGNGWVRVPENSRRRHQVKFLVCVKEGSLARQVDDAHFHSCLLSTSHSSPVVPEAQPKSTSTPTRNH